MPLLLLLFAFIAIVHPAPAQVQFHAGVTGGVPITHTFHSPRDESRRYTLGPLIELSFLNNFAISVNPLYKRNGYTAQFLPLLQGSLPGSPGGGGISQPILSSVRARGHSWELPVMGKYYFGSPDRSWRPFAATGYSFQRSYSEFDNTVFNFNSQTGQATLSSFSSSSEWTPLRVGAIAAAGIEIRGGSRFSLLPEIRYTRWGDRSIGKQDQVDFLFSIRF